MNDDLYTSPQTTNVPNSAPVVTNSNSATSFFDSAILLPEILYWLNVIAFAWTVFYSVVFVVEFFFYRIKYPDGEFVAREQKGVQALYHAAGLWWGFLFCVVLYLLYFIQPEGAIKTVMGVVTACAYCIKILVADMPLIPVIGTFFGKPGQIIQDFLDNLGDNSVKALTSVVDGIAGIFGGSGGAK